MTTSTDNSVTKFADAGYAIIERVLTSAEVDRACIATDMLFDGVPRVGFRDPYVHSEILRDIADSPAVSSIARGILGPSARVVRSILFDKTPAANWDVAWHQDVTIAVQRRHNVPGFGPWSTKTGVVSVQPPAEVLERMLTIRLHLDDCGATNGPLLVVPGSHRRGFTPVQTLDLAACERDAVPCLAAAGDAVIMRPLTLHASKKSLISGHRRVLHLDFSADELPPPLRWNAGD